MKQKILSLLVLLLTAATGAWAEELTVYDGTATNSYVPVYGFYADAYLKCQAVYPATELAAMAGNSITSLTYYATAPATEAWNSTFQVHVIEVADATISSYNDLSTATLVYEGTLDGTQSTMTIPFTTPYNYQGGNLLVSVSLTITGNYKSITWGGETVEGASVQGYNYSDFNAIPATQRNFLPKTTFTYEPSNVEVTTNAAQAGDFFTEAWFNMPAYDATVDYELVRDMSVQMTVKVGEEGEDGYRIRIKKDGESFVPAEMTLQEMMGLYKVHDGIENQDLVFYGDGKVCDISIFAVDDQDQPTGDAIAFAALTPGRYVAIATAAQGSIYDGQTAASNIFELYAQYDIAFTAGNDYAIDGTTASITTQEGQNEAVDVTENIDENGLLEDVKPEATVTVTAAEGYVISAFTATLPESTDNLASINTEKTAAQFAMPESNVNVGFTFLRNMAVNMDVTVGDGEDGYRIRVKKNEQQQFEPAEMQFDAMLALFTVNDEIEEKTLTFYGQTVDCSLSIYAVDENGEPTGDAIAFQALTPGRYVAIATAAENSDYDGVTGYSNIFQLYEGFPVVVPATEGEVGETIDLGTVSFYTEEFNLKLDPANQAKLYTLTAIDGSTVTATQVDVVPAGMPFFVLNEEDVDQMVTLIPADDNELPTTSPLVIAEFLGATEDLTFTQDDMDGAYNYYVLYKGAFVWVKDPGTLKAGKCYLRVPKNQPTTARRIVFGDATAVYDLNDKSEMINDNYYDLNGRKVNAPKKKGVYIQNGRKVVVK